jgi:hypothetical protein
MVPMVLFMNKQPKQIPKAKFFMMEDTCVTVGMVFYVIAKFLKKGIAVRMVFYVIAKSIKYHTRNKEHHERALKQMSAVINIVVEIPRITRAKADKSHQLV